MTELASHWADKIFQAAAHNATRTGSSRGGSLAHDEGAYAGLHELAQRRPERGDYIGRPDK